MNRPDPDAHCRLMVAQVMGTICHGINHHEGYSKKMP